MWAWCHLSECEALDHSKPHLMMTEVKVGLEQDLHLCRLSREDKRSTDWWSNILSPPPPPTPFPPPLPFLFFSIYLSWQTAAEGSQECLTRIKGLSQIRVKEEENEPCCTAMASVLADVSTNRTAPWCSLGRTGPCAESRDCLDQNLSTHANTETD